MILIIDTCKDKLSEMEFVRPVALLVEDHNIKHYTEIKKEDLKEADKIIITGTALKDFDYLEANFDWLLEIEKPVLGICAGMQIIAKTYGIQLATFVTIGVKPVEVVSENKLANGKFNAYFLHTKTGTGDFQTLATTNGKPCMIKHPQKEIYGCIFHPEVMNEDIIKKFIQSQ
ncbi:MAG TPA: hypothetical protein VI612_04635 [Candidatus Nanoarchaeia archaeon]|nr:hypothetical protein [Candidatus Nanoarchaeia archaeon]